MNGRKRWIIGGDIDLGGAGAASVVDPDGDKIYGIGWLKLSVDEVHAASSQIPARLRLMDEVGVHAQIVYPNAVGFGGQRFQPAALDKVRALRSRLDLVAPTVPIQIDGGVNPQNAPECRQAGVGILVAGSAVFNAQQTPQQALAELLEALRA